MQRSKTGLIGGLLATVALVGGLVIAGLIGDDGGANAETAGASPVEQISASGCIPVAAHDGTDRAAGCVLASDHNAPPPVYEKLTARHGGLPVYGDASAREQVGILASGPLGFVPQALVGQLPALTACHGQLSQHLATPKVAAISADCTALLRADGYPESLLIGTTPSFGTASTADTTSSVDTGTAAN